MVDLSDSGNTPLLEVCDLRTCFCTDEGIATAVDGVSLRIPRGKTVALVGESGCGKSVTALSIMRLVPDPPGRIVGGQVLLHPRRPLPHGRGSDGSGASSDGKGASVEGERSDPDSCGPIDLLRLSERQMRGFRGNRVAMIFQEPTASLNPVISVGEQIAEAVRLHQRLDGRAARAAAVEMLRKVGIAAPKRRASEYPHQLSGGMCQRVMIAMALCCKPSLLIADEPTTALDVTIQRQILDLLRAMQAEMGMSILFITHDLGVVAQAADLVYVMYAGRIVEHAPAADLFANPLHPYTQGLLRCLPQLTGKKDRLEAIPGTLPDPKSFPAGCRFHPRCQASAEAARRGGRETVGLSSAAYDKVLKTCVHPSAREASWELDLRERGPGHFVACPEVTRPRPSHTDP